jgi:MFS family permease
VVAAHQAPEALSAAGGDVPAEQPVSRAGRVQVASLLAVSLFAGFSLNVFNGSLPIYLRGTEGYPLEAVGVLVGLASVPQLFSPVFAAPLIDRRGPRLALRAGALVAVLACAILLVTASAVGIGIARVLQGVSYALILPGSYALLPQLIPKRRLGMATGAFGVVPSLALAVGPPVGLGLLDLGPVALFLAAIVSAGLAVLATLPLPEATRSPRPFRLLTFDRRWLPLLAVTFLTVLYWGVVTAYLPLHVPSNIRSSVGWFFTADALGVLAVRIPAGYITDRFGPRWLLAGGIILTALAVLLLLPVSTPPLLVLAGIGTGAGAALLLPPILIELTRLSDENNRGSAMSLYTSCFAAAVAVGSLVGGPIILRFGFNAALLMSVVACLAALPIALLSGARRTAHQAAR